VKEIQRRNREVNLKEDRFWLSNFRQYYANGENPEEMLEFNKLVDNLTAEAIQQSAKKYFNSTNYVKVVLYPEKK
jgi:zinc protease